MMLTKRKSSVNSYSYTGRGKKHDMHNCTQSFDNNWLSTYMYCWD